MYTSDLCSLLLRQQVLADRKIDEAEALALVADIGTKLDDLATCTGLDKERVVRLELAVDDINKRQM